MSLPLAACSHGGLPDSPFAESPRLAHRPRCNPTPRAWSSCESCLQVRSEHRIVIDARTLAQLRDSARRHTQAWRYTSARCDEAISEPRDSGYQGFEWADAVASLALCWHATGESRYATSAVSYLAALLDDRFKIGDGKGGATVVTHDFGIRHSHVRRIRCAGIRLAAGRAGHDSPASSTDRSAPR